MMGRLFPVQQEQITSDDCYTPRWVLDRSGIPNPEPPKIDGQLGLFEDGAA